MENTLHVLLHAGWEPLLPLLGPCRLWVWVWAWMKASKHAARSWRKHSSNGVRVLAAAAAAAAAAPTSGSRRLRAHLQCTSLKIKVVKRCLFSRSSTGATCPGRAGPPTQAPGACCGGCCGGCDARPPCSHAREHAPHTGTGFGTRQVPQAAGRQGACLGTHTSPCSHLRRYENNGGYALQPSALAACVLSSLHAHVHTHTHIITVRQHANTGPRAGEALAAEIRGWMDAVEPQPGVHAQAVIAPCVACCCYVCANLLQAHGPQEVWARAVPTRTPAHHPTGTRATATAAT